MAPEQNLPPKRRIPWIAICLAIAALIALMAGNSNNGRGVVEMMTVGSYGVGSSAPMPPSMEQSANSMARDSMIAPDYYPYPSGEVPITDTREFLKTDYNASIRTRDVQGLTRRAETIVRGHDGRIDGSSSSEKYGYVQFAIPMSQFEQFRDEIEGLVNKRFLTIQVSRQNMLPQKLSIEERQKLVETTLADLKAARSKAVAAYNTTAANLQAQLANVQQDINTVIANPDAPGNQARLAVLQASLSNLQVQLSSEKTANANKLASYDSQIKNVNLSLSDVQDQDKDLLDTVATVRGTVNFQWISLWEIAHLYLPGAWIPTIIAALAAIAFMYERRLYLFRGM